MNFNTILLIIIVSIIIAIILCVIYIPSYPTNIDWQYLPYSTYNYIYKVGVPITPVIPSYSLFTNYVFFDTLPTGLSYDSITGIITGTPTEPSSEKMYGVVGNGVNRSGASFIVITVNA